MSPRYSAHSKDYSLRIIQESTKAFMLFGRLRSRQQDLTASELQVAEQRSMRLSRRFGHLICELGAGNGRPVPNELLPQAQLELQQGEQHQQIRLRMEEWFNEANECDQASCFDAYCFWVMVSCFADESIRERYLNVIKQSEVDGLVASDEGNYLMDLLAKCYHFQAFVAFFMGTFSYNRFELEEKEEAALRPLASAHGVLVSPTPNAKQAHSHTAFGQFMNYTHWYSRFEVVDQARPQPCRLCGDGGSSSSTKGRVPSIILSEPRKPKAWEVSATPPRETRDKEQVPVCQPCLQLFQAYWIVYHFLDIVVPKHLEEYMTAYAQSGEEKTISSLWQDFLAKNRKGLLNLFNENRDILFGFLSCYFVRPIGHQLLAESFEHFEYFSEFLESRHTLLLERSLEAVLVRGRSLLAVEEAARLQDEADAPKTAAAPAKPRKKKSHHEGEPGAKPKKSRKRHSHAETAEGAAEPPKKRRRKSAPKAPADEPDAACLELSGGEEPEPTK